MAGKTKKELEEIKREARRLFVWEALCAKEIASKLFISEKTLSKWVNEHEGVWKKERQARLTSTESGCSNIRQIIQMLSEDRLNLMHAISEAEQNGERDRAYGLRAEASAIDASVEKWSKQLIDKEKRNRITLAIYLDVMDRIFTALKLYNPALYSETLDFQESHVYYITKQIG